jgi:hypothetical protein
MLQVFGVGFWGARGCVQVLSAEQRDKPRPSLPMGREPGPVMLVAYYAAVHRQSPMADTTKLTWAILLCI